MRADPTLVEGAFRAAMAKVPGDYSKFFWQEMRSNQLALDTFIKSGQDIMDYKKLLNEETKAREVLRKKASDNQWNQFEKVIDEAGIKFASYQRGGDQESFHQKIYDLYLDSADDFKERYRVVNTTGDDDTPENKKERQTIWGELNASINELKNFGTEVLTLAALNKGKHLSKEGMNGAKSMYLISEIVNQDGDWSNVDVERTKEEGLVFIVDGTGYIDPLTGGPAVNEDGSPWGKIRVSSKNFMKNIIPKAAGQQQWYLDATAGDEQQVIKAAGQGKRSKFNFFNSKEAITKNMLTDEAAYVDLTNRPFIEMEDGRAMSVRDIWFDNPELQTATYGGLGVTLAQQVGNKDNFITEEDFLLPADRQKIADALFRPTLSDGTPNPNFSWEAGTDVASDILAQARQKRHADLVRATPIERVGGGGGGGDDAADDEFTFKPQWGYDLKYPTGEGEFSSTKIKGQVIRVAVAKLESSKEGDNIDGWNANVYKYINGEWRNETTGDATTRNQIAIDLGLQDYGISWNDPVVAKFGGGYTRGGGKIIQPTANWGKATSR